MSALTSMIVVPEQDVGEVDGTCVLLEGGWGEVGDVWGLGWLIISFREIYEQIIQLLMKYHSSLKNSV